MARVRRDGSSDFSWSSSWHDACLGAVMTNTRAHVARSALALLASFASLLGCAAAAEDRPPLPSVDAPDPRADLTPRSNDLGAVHVSPVGNDEAPGSPEAPVRTFARAIELAREGSRRLALCAGVFTEPLVLDAEHRADRFTVTGEASCQGFSKAASVVRSDLAPPLEVFAVGGPIRIFDVTFEHTGAARPGASSIAARVAYVDDLAFTRVTLRAGPGADGDDASTVTVAPCDAAFDPRDPNQVGRTGLGARVVGRLGARWEPAGGEDGGVLRFPRSSRCVEPSVQTGAGGMGGGASVALVARMAHVTFEASILAASDAGGGGRGGSSQAPSCDPLAQKSCEVLDLGGGGGGAGGVSAAVLHRQSVFDADGATKLLHGAPGAGGSGGSGARWLHGTAGVAGVAGPFVGADEDDEGAVSGASP